MRLLALLAALLLMLSPLAAAAHGEGCDRPMPAGISSNVTVGHNAAPCAMPCCGHGKACATPCACAAVAHAAVPTPTAVAWRAYDTILYSACIERPSRSAAKDAEIRPPKRIA